MEIGAITTYQRLNQNPQEIAFGTCIQPLGALVLLTVVPFSANVQRSHRLVLTPCFCDRITPTIRIFILA